jgi:hypothetical protein|tara:strand:- start:8931 stop:9692 length:762 start_codon:yes stop_codon:yes gene_type:complete
MRDLKSCLGFSFEVMMNKNKLEKFILKYNLGGNIESTKWSVSNDQLITIFITPDKSLMGKVTVENFSFENATFGVFSTSLLRRLLNTLGDSIDLILQKIDSKPVSLEIKDTNATVSFMLADLAVIASPPKLSKLPDFETKIKMDNNTINTYIKGKNALADVNTFTIVNDEKLQLVIGQSTHNTNRVYIPVEGIEVFLFDNFSFNADIFKEILLANRECEVAILEISNQGLAHIVFNSGDYKSEYFLTAIVDLD